jgi:hypothetical protein
MTRGLAGFALALVLMGLTVRHRLRPGSNCTDPAHSFGSESFFGHAPSNTA